MREIDLATRGRQSAGAKGGTRTPTPLLASGPKPGASTNFATLARIKKTARAAPYSARIIRDGNCSPPLHRCSERAAGGQHLEGYNRSIVASSDDRDSLCAERRGRSTRWASLGFDGNMPVGDYENFPCRARRSADFGEKRTSGLQRVQAAARARRVRLDSDVRPRAQNA